jgi:O-antigen ligase
MRLRIISIRAVDNGATNEWIMYALRLHPAIAKNLRAMVLLGAITPVLPFLGLLPILLLAILLIAIESRGALLAHLRWGSCLIALLAASTLVSFLVLLPSHFALELSPASRLHLLAQTILPPRAVNAPIWGFVRMLLFVVAVSVFSQSSRARSDFSRGLCFGLGLCVLVGLAEICGLFAQALPHRGSFWQGQLRYGALFTDPNSCGVFLALSLPFIAARREYPFFLRTTLLLALFVLGLFTGSRSFALALLVISAAYLWRVSRGAVFGLVVLLGVGIIAASIWPEATLGLPSMIQRVWLSLSLPHMQEAFFSRAAFANLAVAMWLDNPLFGVAFEGFRQHMHQYAQALKIPLGLWTDNSNNFYLGILAETGIFGAIGWLLLLAHLRLRVDACSWCKLSVAILAVLLLTGPHFEFIEVSIFSAFIIGSTFTISPVRLALPQLAAFSVCLVSATIWYGVRGIGGLYDPERSGESVVYWTDAAAVTYLPCQSSHVVLGVRATNPDIASAPVILRLVGDTAEAELRLTNSLEERITFACRPGAKEMRVRLSVNHTWQPSDYGLGADSRRLGVQISQRN